MIQEHIYTQDINRSINGVIKASSTADLANEVKEYVITAEQQKKSLLPALFKMLVPPAVPTCVWISGDFGSGKSHLLKILSYVLENQLAVDGRKVADIFADKAGDDFELRADITNACRIPTETVLFNIQEKLDGVSKNSVDPVLNIFLKEFNRKLGFDDKKPEIAEIERYFASKGKYQFLKDEYQRLYGVSWEEKGRKTVLLQLQKLAKIFAEMEGIDEQTAYNNLKSAIDNYKLDTDGFVALVKDHLDKSAPGTRFIFFVDEVGQFIGKDVHRMLSLQTIAEGLVDKTGGRATLMVTSQMDIDTTLGNLEKQQEYDFSRIQGRFTTRINLTSANADEVIQRRLLEKKQEPEAELCEIYAGQKNIMKSLFNFGDNSQFVSRYKSAEEFAVDFPFIDYQFNLVQAAIIELSKNNAFSGKQQSVGERSLLSIAQEVAKAYKDYDLTRIVRFCDMYKGIQGSLQAKIQNDILQAERTLGDEMALDVLKTLFLVKYVKGFPSTVDNITKILLPTLDTDFPEYRKKVQEALNLLVRQSYVEKGANDEYHYQTNEEKDIENEIKQEELAPDAINNELMKIFRDEIFPESKIKLNGSSNKVFPFGRFVDGNQDGRDFEISIHFATPLGEDLSNEGNALMYSARNGSHLCVVLGEDKYLGEDIAMFKKADKCLTRLLSSNTDKYRLQIITDKRRVNAGRLENIKARIAELTKGARLYIGGNELTDIRSTDIRTRLNEGMMRLIEKIYRNLSMLQVDYDDAMLKRVINAPESGALFAETMDNAETEVFNKINSDKRMSIRTKVKDLVDYFKSNGYGWYEMAVLVILARLFKMDKVSFTSDGSRIEARDLYYHLTNSNRQANLIVDIEESITPSQITKLKNLYKDTFNDEVCRFQSAKDVHQAFLDRLNQEIQKLRELRDGNRYPFATALDDIISGVERYSRVAYPTLYVKFKDVDDALADKEDADTIREFVEGPQLRIFKQICQLKTGNQANLTYVDSDLLDIINRIYDSAKPWNNMTEAAATLEKISAQISVKQEEARQQISEKIESKLLAITSLPEYSLIPENLKSQIQALFNAAKSQVREERYIGNLRSMSTDVDRAYDHSIGIINRWSEEEARKAAAAAAAAAGGGATGGSGTAEGNSGSGSGATPPATQHRQMVSKQTAMNVHFDKSRLESEADVEKYIVELHHRLMDFISDNKIIMLN